MCQHRQHTSAYVPQAKTGGLVGVSIRQHTYRRLPSKQRAVGLVGVSIRQHTSAYVPEAAERAEGRWAGRLNRQRLLVKHLSEVLRNTAYVRIRLHTSVCICLLVKHLNEVLCVTVRLSAYVGTRQHTSACVSIRQQTPAYVSIRQHTTYVRVGVRQLLLQRPVIAEYADVC